VAKAKAKEASTPRMLKITQIHSGLGRAAKQRATLEALGLRKHQQTVYQPDNAAIRGMIFQVQHLLRVEELPQDEGK
jgi:large subunit ribosomal protein L30